MSIPLLYGTLLSHFTRKVRILLAESDVPFELVRVPGVLATMPTGYGDNPMMRIPTLVHEGQTLFDSNHIARYCVRTFDARDRLGVRDESVSAMNRLAVIDGVMSNEVVLILAKRGGLGNVEDVVYFRKLLAAIREGLGWLDRHTDPDAEGFDYRDVAMICMGQHLAHYQVVDLEPFSRIRGRIARFAGRSSVASTTPEASLAEATAAGWTPG